MEIDQTTPAEHFTFDQTTHASTSTTALPAAACCFGTVAYLEPPKWICVDLDKWFRIQVESSFE